MILTFYDILFDRHYNMMDVYTHNQLDNNIDCLENHIFYRNYIFSN